MLQSTAQEGKDTIASLKAYVAQLEEQVRASSQGEGNVALETVKAMFQMQVAEVDSLREECLFLREVPAC